MSSATLDIIFNQVLGAVIGLIVSFVISWYFYKKADLPSRMAAKMLEEIRLMIIQERLDIPADFDNITDTPRNEIPKDQDIPHIWRIYHQKLSVKQGETVCLLFQVIDEGSNFNGNIETLLENRKVIYPIKRQGFGYYSSEISIPSDMEPGIYSIQVKLTDRARKSNTHYTKVKVTS